MVLKRSRSCVVWCILILCITACAKKDAAKSHEIEGLEWQESENPEYATGFTIDKYSDGFRLITIAADRQFLIVPEGCETPQELKNDICVINQPVTNIYLVASAAMDMFRSLDAIDTIRLSGTDADGWYIEEAKRAIEDGAMLYAGKYNTPDYELILLQEYGDRKRPYSDCGHRRNSCRETDRRCSRKYFMADTPSRNACGGGSGWALGLSGYLLQTFFTIQLPVLLCLGFLREQS